MSAQDTKISPKEEKPSADIRKAINALVQQKNPLADLYKHFASKGLRLTSYIAADVLEAIQNKDAQIVSALADGIKSCGYSRDTAAEILNLCKTITMTGFGYETIDRYEPVAKETRNAAFDIILSATKNFHIPAVDPRTTQPAFGVLKNIFAGQGAISRNFMHWDKHQNDNTLFDGTCKTMAEIASNKEKRLDTRFMAIDTLWSMASIDFTSQETNAVITPLYQSAEFNAQYKWDDVLHGYVDDLSFALQDKIQKGRFAEERFIQERNQRVGDKKDGYYNGVVLERWNTRDFEEIEALAIQLWSAVDTYKTTGSYMKPHCKSGISGHDAYTRDLGLSNKVKDNLEVAYISTPYDKSATVLTLKQNDCNLMTVFGGKAYSRFSIKDTQIDVLKSFADCVQDHIAPSNISGMTKETKASHEYDQRDKWWIAPYRLANPA